MSLFIYIRQSKPRAFSIVFFSLALMFAALSSQESMAGKPSSPNYILGGVQAGYSFVNPAVGVTESVKDGYAYSIRAIYSRYAGPFIFDFGGGYIYQRVKGNPSFGQFNSPDVVVATQAGFAEFSPRFWLDDRFQLGVVGKALFGVDVTFSESNYWAGNQVSVLTGPRLNMEIGDRYRTRVGFEGLIDVNVPGRQVWLFLVDLQFGLPLGGGDAHSSDKADRPVMAPMAVADEAVPAEKRTTRLMETKEYRQEKLTKIPVANKGARVFQSGAVAQAASDASVKITLGEVYLKFPKGKAFLPPQALPSLRTVAEFLVGSQTRWTKVRVEGHTDRTGTAAKNDQLSMARGQAVAAQLVRGGVPYQSISVQGMGARSLIDPGSSVRAHSTNRRVEIYLEGVRDPDSLVAEMNQL